MDSRDKAQPTLLRLLFAAPNTGAANRLISALRSAGVAVRSASADSTQVLTGLLQQPWDVIVSYDGAALTLAALLDTLRCNEQELPIIVVAAATASTPQGASEVIAATDLERLTISVQRAAAVSQVQRRCLLLEQRLRELEQRHELVLNGSNVPLAYIQDGIHLYCNPAYARCFSYATGADLAPIPLLDLFVPAERPRLKALLASAQNAKASGIVPIRRSDGSEEPMQLSLTPVEYDGRPCLQLTLERAPGDGTYANALREISRQDLLTQLDNAAYFLTRIEEAIRTAVRDSVHAALVLVDVTDFAEIGAALGKSSANMVLNDIGRFLRGHIGDRGAVARLKEHEFAMLVQDGDPDRLLALVREVAGRINNRISPAMLPSLQLSCRVGTTLINARSGNAERVLERARTALHEALPETGRHFRYRVGDSFEHSAADMLDYLKSALLNRRFKLLYQPLVSMQGEAVNHYEVRARMLDRDGNEVSPTAFLPLANLNGLGEEFDRLVIGMALDAMSGRQAEERLLINITANTLMSRTFLPWLSERLRAGRLRSDSLLLQISEIDIHGNPARALEFCDGLRQLNAASGICRFGCALDPFSLLESLEPAIVKLDETLVRDVLYSGQQKRTVREIIAKLHAKGLLVIAPQVEDMDVLPLLWQAGADYVQGYCLQRPSDEMNFEFVHVEEITLPAAQS